MVRGNNNNLNFRFRRSRTRSRCGQVHSLIGRRLGRCFHPRFLGHLSRVVIFHRLAGSRIGRVSSVLLGRIFGHLARGGVGLRIARHFGRHLIRRNCGPDCKTHPLHQTVVHLLRSALTRRVLSNQLNSNSATAISMSSDNGIAVRTRRQHRLVSTRDWNCLLHTVVVEKELQLSPFL